MTDIIYYLGKYSLHSVISGFKNIYTIPDIGEKVIIGEVNYVVKERMFDYDKNTVHIKVSRIGHITDKLYDY